MRHLRAVLDFLYPPRCPACRRRTEAPAFCPGCRGRILPARSPLCSACGLPFNGQGPDHLCANCHLHPPGFRQARARAAFDGHQPSPLVEVLARFKYGRDITMAAVLAGFLVEQLPMTLYHDLVVPIPLHRDRLRWRGFNQALPLARAIARKGTCPVDPFVLARRRSTPPQVGLGAADRRRNVKGAFVVRNREQVQDRTILLVDDVMTTGATAHECARVLRAAGARHVDAIVLARALDPS